VRDLGGVALHGHQPGGRHVHHVAMHVLEHLERGHKGARLRAHDPRAHDVALDVARPAGTENKRGARLKTHQCHAHVVDVELVHIP